MSVQVLARPGIPSNAMELLDRARVGLHAAETTPDAGSRYAAAHLAALRAAAAVLAVRGRPRRGGALSVWLVLPRVAPELGEWAAFFAAGASRRSAIDAGRSDVVSTREADDLLRDARTFADVVAEALGLLPVGHGTREPTFGALAGFRRPATGVP